MSREITILNFNCHEYSPYYWKPIGFAIHFQFTYFLKTFPVFNKMQTHEDQTQYGKRHIKFQLHIFTRHEEIF